MLGWPDLDERARLTADDLSAEIGIGLPSCWVDDDTIACYVIEESLILTDGSLGSPRPVDLPVILGDEGDIEALLPLAPGRIAVNLWQPSGRSTLILGED